MTKKTAQTDRALFNKTVERKSIVHRNRRDNVRTPNPNRRKTVPVPKVRSSLTPGTVVILLAGPYKGKRVVLLKVLESGSLAVTGPYHVNGIPLRRINPRFVAATSTKLPVEEMDVSNLTDSFFSKPKTRKVAKKEKEDVFMAQGAKAAERVLPEEKVAAQKQVDSVLLKFLERSENSLLKQYLKTRFTLRERMFPHELKF